MNILVIYPYIPYPLDRGTYQRTFHLLRELSGEHRIDLLALSENGEGLEHRSVFESFCNSVNFVRFEHPRWPKLLSGRLLKSTPSTLLHWKLPHIAEAIRDQLKRQRYDLVHVCDIVMAQYFLDDHLHIPLSMDRSRVDLQFQRQRTTIMAGSLKDKLLAQENMFKLARFEKRIAQRTQLQVLCGPDDETFMRAEVSKTAPLKVIANGVDLDYFNADSSRELRAEKPTILFCGAMDYAPNIDALRWYFAEMHQALKARVPALEVLIVGKSPVSEVASYAQREGVTVTGSVPDVRPYYRQAWLQMVPLRIGGGTRLKIVESLAIGTPVVSTIIGAQGLSLEHKNDVLLADDAMGFVDQIERALGDRQLRDQLQASGIITARSRFSWKSIGADFIAALAAVGRMDSRQSPSPADNNVMANDTLRERAGLRGDSSKVSPNQRMTMMDVPFDSVTMQDTLQRIGSMIVERRPSFIATANVDFLVQARSDRELHALLQRADMVVCDGTPLLWLSRLLGKALPERVAGSDLVPKLLAEAAEKDWSIFFLGGRDEVLHQAVRNVQHQHPSLRIAGAYSPPFASLDKMDHEAINAHIREAKPDILLVSFGCPKQEKWIARNCEAHGVPVSIGVGATIDFLAGAVKRAPTWMRHCGLEWVFRLAQEPRRLLKRYATDLYVFGIGAITELLRNRRAARA